MNARAGVDLALTGPANGRRSMGVAPTVIFGVVAIVLFLGGFGAWAALASLESAAIAPGRVSVEGRRKTVEHLEGGIVADILVEEGEVVAAGQRLIVLGDTQARTAFSMLEGRYHATAALKARLEAERDGLAAIRWPGWLREAVPDAGILTAQERIFEARRQLLDTRGAISGQRIAQMREEVARFAEEIDAQDRQIALIEEELEAFAALVAKGYERKPRTLELERRRAELAGERARSRARIARVEQSVGETRLRLTEQRNAHLNEVVEALRESDASLADLRERRYAARDVLARTRIDAPISGTIIDLRVFTRGGVVAPGEPLMDIVPIGSRLVIEARIAPVDIDVVRPDLPAQVRLTAFSHLTTPPLSGRVLQVSADSLVDERTGTPFYAARVVLDPGQPTLDDRVLQPGMPAEVMIVTGRRTPLDYFLHPIAASLSRALRED